MRCKGHWMGRVDQVRRDIQVNIEEYDKYGVETLRALACRRTLWASEAHGQEQHQIVLNLESEDGLEVHESHGPGSDC